KFVQASFISYITDKNNKIIYTNPKNQKQVFREDTAYLMTDMLKSSVNNGTAKKLNELNFPIASKTGTVGKTENTDAWNISYTTNDIVGVWIGNVDNSSIGKTVGGGLTTDIAKFYHKNVNTKPPEDFSIPTSIYEEKIDMLALINEHEVVKANNFIPQKYIITEKFSKFNQPKDKSTHFISVLPVKLDGFVKDNKAILNFEAKDYMIYDIYKIVDNKQQLVACIMNKNGKISEEFSIENNKKVQFFVVTKLKNYADNTEIVSDNSNVIELYNKSGSKWFY
ncbi:MAG: hypothetical protein IJA69_01800, partial [Clostridia bacterium]|nr:hypothetical protein [Clostridia bacterium]